ncbi:hypothetical protein PoB_004404900 [Plakobranchus ocellatus]|uniref:Uncharacterized protein n=1 Tax=Plakobranchus ocellatus TaxID=259542 RepID=A0AAV4BFA8_9GAST|nr:hypothetical protein PoB_004404900 [Plakobranchus ocellatus]
MEGAYLRNRRCECNGSPSGDKGDKNSNLKGYRRDRSRSPVHQRRDRGHRGGCNQSPALHGGGGVTDVVIMGVTGDVFMVRRSPEVHKLFLEVRNVGRYRRCVQHTEQYTGMHQRQ